MNTKQQFGHELKKYVQTKKTISAIGHFAYSYYLANIMDIDKEFRRFLIDLSTMEDGLEFELSYEKLHEIADMLIAGKDVTL